MEKQFSLKKGIYFTGYIGVKTTGIPVFRLKEKGAFDKSKTVFKQKRNFLITLKQPCFFQATFLASESNFCGTFFESCHLLFVPI